MSFPKILSFIGNNKKEIEPKKIDFKKPVVPIDDQRKSYAYTLALSATQFLVCHEYAHIINGHLDFNRKTDSQFIFEMTSNKEKEGLLSQTLEFDADSFASQIGINSNIIRFKNKKRIHRDFRPAFKSLEDTLFAWTFSVYTIFRFFGKNTNFDFNKLDKYSHPYPDIRQEYCFVHIPNLIRESEYSESYNLSRSIKAMEEFENAANLIKKGPRTWNFMYMPHPAPIKFVYTKKGWNHLYKILNNWNHVRPLLKPYTEITLSPVVCGDEEEFMKIPKEFYKFN